MVVGVLVELSNKNIDKVFDYNVESNLQNLIKLGIRVKVPFAHQTLEGFVVEIKESSNIELKSIIDVIDTDVVLNSELLRLGKIMQEKTLSTLISCYQVMLPKALKAKNGTIINKKYDIFYKLGNIDIKLTDKQKEVIKLFNNKELVSRKEIINIYSNIKSLIDKKVLIEVKKEHYRLDYKDSILKKYSLTLEQQNVVDIVNNSNDLVYLLHGVTGSGKTEVYMELIDKVLNENKTAIVLVPEISLTPQMVKRFSERFGNNIAALHSALSEGEKYDEWRRINKGEVKIVIGARSALFAPLNNLGLIVIDEEHSDSYKQDDSNPKYDAIDMAIERSKLNDGCKVVLGSATPTLDSYARAKKNVYHLLTLPNRVNKKPLPKVEVVDMNKEIKNSIGHFSKLLIDKINDKLEKNEQVILLLNRRGYSTFVSCKNCGYTVKCPKCDITLTYHKTSNNLRCHYCGYATNLVKVCPECHEEALSSIGVGTEKIEEELNKIIPSARILRMDFDTTSKKGMHSKMIKAFANHEYDILLGTQIVAKGLDFENVTLVGVINADTSLNIPDFHSSETTFALLSQVSGRAGRSDREGSVILQTYNKDHYAIKYAKEHNYIGFYNEELKIRHTLKYPPFYYIVYIRISSKDNNLAFSESLRIKKSLEKHLSNTIILGPSASNVFKVNNTYRYGIILKYKKEDELINTLNMMIDAYKSNSKVKIDINFNPKHL